MTISPKLKKILLDRLEHTESGWIWHGNQLDGIAVVRYCGELWYVSQLAAHLDIKYTDSHKYEDTHEDMGRFDSDGDISELGAGNSQSQQ